MDAKFTNFASQLGNWIDDPSYYTNNASAVLVPVFGWVQNCYPFYDDIGNVYWQCDYYYTIVDWVYQLDYSGFDQDGLHFTANFHAGGDGQLVPDLTPGSAAAKNVDAIFRQVFGVPVLRGTLDTGCDGGVMSYDGETQVNCTPDLMGEILLWRITTFTERGDWRYLTAGEKSAAIGEGLQIKNLDQVRVYHRSYKIFFRKRVIAPNGNIYIGNAQETFGTPWSEDYSLEPNVFHFSTLIHELMHVYQYRTLGWSVPTMAKKDIAALGNYVYMPLVPGKAYYSYNIEQQAEMVRDRFLKRRGLITYDPGNSAATFALLNGLIPF
jgi:hypothetical protein